MTPLDIIADGLIINSSVGELRPIPAVIIDSQTRPEISEFIDAHINQPPGDITVQWGEQAFSKNNLILLIIASRPVKLEFGIRFNISANYALINGIIRSNAMYLQTGLKGDKVSNRIGTSQILLEVGDTGFEIKWNSILLNFLIKNFKGKGFKKEQAKIAAHKEISTLNDLLDIRQNNIKNQ
ncbi:hypothetical protein [Leptospira kanakyensis]|nr:hypothetical protein [Leptospira kanakyensis]